MRGRFEFTFHEIAPAAAPSPDVALVLLGSQGWEIRGIAVSPGGATLVALQRPLDEERPLAESTAIAATLEEPLVAPGVAELDPKVSA